MYKWITMKAAAEVLRAKTGKTVSIDDLLELAFNGALRVCASIPGYQDSGRGELVFYAADGSSFGSVTDGFYQGLTRRDFQALQSHGRLYLAGRRGELPNEGGEPIKVILGPDSPAISVSDLRVSERELQRFMACEPGAQTKDGEANRVTGWRRVLRDNLPEIVQIHRTHGSRGSLARLALRWLRKNGPRDKISPIQPDDDSLEWLDQDGNPHKVTLKTIQNTLAKYRKDGLFPGDLK